MEKKLQKGFTLIELLVVIAIIGILSTLAVVSLGNARTRARDSKRLADMRALQSALEIYYTDQQAYPVGASVNIEGQYLCNVSGAGGGWQAAACATANTQLVRVPNDPVTAKVYTYVAAGATPTTYTINFEQESPTAPLATFNCLSPGGMVADATPDATCP